MTNMLQSAAAQAQRTGLRVFVILAVLTFIEYVIAVSIDQTVLLVVLLAGFAVAKAFLIVQYFMHITSLWAQEETH